MKNLFPQHYRPSENEFIDLFKECIFIFDANMLLNFYRYPQRAREDLFKILRKISETNRLWLPFQVALEFQENRLTVIADQKRKFSQVKKVIVDIQNDLQKKLDELQLKKRHSSIDPDVLVKEINTSFQKYKERLDKLESEQLDIVSEDYIRAEIDQLFDGKIGIPFSQSELDTIFNEGNIRYKSKRPPGYADEADKKGTFTFYKDLVIKREFGDLIVWNEILKYVNETKPKGLVFITDDNKEDWWLEISGKTVGPRSELLSELHSKTELKMFYIYNSERFMSVASSQLDIQIGYDSIEQVKIISEELRLPFRLRLIRELRRMYEDKCQVCGFDKGTEMSIIIPRSANGRVNINNFLLLCPNHHSLFDKGMFSINDDYQLIGIDGQLTVHSEHELSLDGLRYHREKIFGSK